MSNDEVISGRRGGVSGVQNIRKYTNKSYFLCCFLETMIFHFFPVVPEAREVSKNLPDTRGVIFPEYEPVASHHDPIQPQNHEFLHIS